MTQMFGPADVPTFREGRAIALGDLRVLSQIVSAILSGTISSIGEFQYRETDLWTSTDATGFTTIGRILDAPPTNQAFIDALQNLQFSHIAAARKTVLGINNWASYDDLMFVFADGIPKKMPTSQINTPLGTDLVFGYSLHADFTYNVLRKGASFGIQDTKNTGNSRDRQPIIWAADANTIELTTMLADDDSPYSFLHKIIGVKYCHQVAAIQFTPPDPTSNTSPDEFTVLKWTVGTETWTMGGWRDSETGRRFLLLKFADVDSLTYDTADRAVALSHT